MGIMKSLRFLLLFILIPIFGLSQNTNIENESLADSKMTKEDDNKNSKEKTGWWS